MTDDANKQIKFTESKQSAIKWAIIIILPFIIFFVSLFMGRYSVSPREVVQIFANYFFGANFAPTWEDSAAKVIIQVRFPRAVMAALVGAGLSSSGASFQGMFQNPLVSPFILGVSAGASFGAALGLVLSMPSMAVQCMAFIFGIVAVAITYFLAHIYKSTPVLMLVLSGTVVSAFFQALLQILKFTAEGDEKLPAITFWLMGSLGSVALKDLVISIIPIITCLIGLWVLSWRINVLS
ncbi:MAG: iron ABC transporter permease, partial [Firmicutes bacterium]|nr:iron ABC transporter permease [Bacillota bacterium]